MKNVFLVNDIADLEEKIRVDKSQQEPNPLTYSKYYWANVVPRKVYGRRNNIVLLLFLANLQSVPQSALCVPK